jgi:metal-dependent hydrolase (beta-lactamase superfamily II)
MNRLFEFKKLSGMTEKQISIWLGCSRQHVHTLICRAKDVSDKQINVVVESFAAKVIKDVAIVNAAIKKLEKLKVKK